MNTLVPKIVVVNVGLLCTQALAHHSGESPGAPFSHIVEVMSAGVAVIAIASLIVLLLKPSR